LRQKQILRVPASALSGSASGTTSIHSFQIVSAEPHICGVVSSSTTQVFIGFSEPTEDGTRCDGNDIDKEMHLDDLEIDEAFLASSVLQPLRAVVHESSSTGCANSNMSQDVDFEVERSQRKMSSDDEHTLFLTAHDLNQVGLLSGDWVFHFTRLPSPSLSFMLGVGVLLTMRRTVGARVFTPGEIVIVSEDLRYSVFIIYVRL
jgi:hypothetical protein